jgi:hypothetical protein
LTTSGVISFWAFVPHKPEDDEAGLKLHSHLYVEPAKMLQTDDLTKALKEFDPVHPDKPLGCITWRSSKFDSWYLYGLHNKRYLASKGQSRKFHYEHSDIATSDEDDLLFKARSIDLISLSPYADMEEAQRNGLSWLEYFSRGTIPIQQVALFKCAWDMLLESHTNRNGHEGHSFDIDDETGEIMEDAPF